METRDVGGEDRNAKMVRLVLGDELSEPDILRALSQCGNNPDAAINFILDTPGLFPAMTVKRTVTSTGARISPQIKQEKGEGSEEVESADGSKPIARVKEEPVLGFEKESLDWVQKSKPKMSFDEFLQATNTKVMADDLFMTQFKEENTNKSDEAESIYPSKEDVKVKEEFDLGIEKPKESKAKIRETLQKPSYVKKGRVEDLRVSTVVIEDGDFPEETDWLLVGRTTITGLSTTKGRKLENNEIVHFAFPSADKSSRYSSPWMSAKTAAASSGIVRFSTKRSGEVISELAPNAISIFP